MYMEAKLQKQIAFFLTGRRDSQDLEPMDGDRRPALFASFRDLSPLRYDYPLILNTEGPPERYLLSLSTLVDDAVEELADNLDRDRIARHGHTLEAELRRQLRIQGPADLATLWNDCTLALAAGDEKIESSAKRLWTSFRAAGEIVDADANLPLRVVRHAWSVIQNEKADASRDKAQRLLLKLHNILDAEVTGSTVGRAPSRLKAGVGAAFAGTFDFDALSNILIQAKPGVPLSDERRQRIIHLIDVLENQRFYPLGPGGPEPYKFVFDTCSDALMAYRERHPEAVEFLKALSIAELETKGEYREAVHGVIFRDFGSIGLDADQLAKLPDYLVTVNAGTLDAAEHVQIVELLSTGLPIRILIQTDDLVEPSAAMEGHIALGKHSRQIIDAAIGLNDVFVLQTTSSDLYRSRQALMRCLSYDGPSLVSIFSGFNEHTRDIPPYLVAAAALESRVFLALVYDPSAGPDWASRLSIQNNPRTEDAWPIHTFPYEDPSLQARSEKLAFTPADFLAMDDRFYANYAIVPTQDWSDAMVPVPVVVRNEITALPDEIPSIMLVDADGRLGRAILDRRILAETRRVQAIWRSLQELGGIHNSHAERLFSIERTKRAAADRPLTSEPNLISAAVITIPAGDDTVASEVPTSVEIAEPAAEKHGDEPWIETARCTTCNECTNLNGLMFAYNDDQQAYIADPSAGTFRDLVEAAEGCQVSIIHPGKPRNPNEPGLEDLIGRAAEFI
jgi:hypothetical protein